jgi:hypothetical protein
MKMKILSIILFGTSLIIAQNNTSLVEHFISLKTQFFQIEEEANYGLVFDGLNLGALYNLIIRNDEALLIYSPEFDFGASFDKGVGLNWKFKPIDFYYGLKINNTIFFGPYLATNYQIQLYPELQSGQAFWFTFIDIGPRFVSEFKLWDYLVNFSISNSFAGFVSRPKINPLSESTFYTLNFGDWVTNSHRNFKFGTIDLLNHSNLKVEIPNLVKAGLSLSYEFEYYGYFGKSKLIYISHGLNLTWCIGSNKEEKE